MYTDLIRFSLLNWLRGYNYIFSKSIKAGRFKYLTIFPFFGHYFVFISLQSSLRIGWFLLEKQVLKTAEVNSRSPVELIYYHGFKPLPTQDRYWIILSWFQTSLKSEQV